MALKAIITAGGGVPRDLAGETTTHRKALLTVGGRTLLQAALTAVDDCTQLGGAVVVGNDEVQAALPAGVDYVREGETLVDNIQRGFEHLGGVAHDYLIVSPDMPFITGGALASFATAATNCCEIGTPLVSRDDFLAAYPAAPNKFLRLAGGRQVTMGSCFYFTGQALRSNIPLIRDLIRMRKHPHRLAVLLGLPILLAFIFKRLRLELVEQRASRLMGVPCRVVEMADAGIAYDVDNRGNYDFAMAWAATGSRKDGGQGCPPH